MYPYPRPRRQVKLNVLFPCGTFGYVITEVQMIMDVNVQLKYKTHIVYEVMRGGRRGYRLSSSSESTSIYNEQRNPSHALPHHIQTSASLTSIRRRPP